MDAVHLTFVGTQRRFKPVSEAVTISDAPTGHLGLWIGRKAIMSNQGRSSVIVTK